MASAQILDGNLVAAQVKEEIKSKLKASNLKLGLGTILVGSDPGSISYVNGKHRELGKIYGINFEFEKEYAGTYIEDPNRNGNTDIYIRLRVLK